MDQKTMRGIVVAKPGEVKIVDDIPVPVPGDYEALVKIHSCGFCNGTDFQIINGTLSKSEGMQEYPVILGHEGCGDIVELGPKVRHLKIGDRFIRPNSYVPHNYNLNYGNMAEYSLAVDYQAMAEDGYTTDQMPFYGNMAKIPNDIDPIDGGVMLSLFECYSSAKDFGITEGMDVLVYGCGPMGLGIQCCIRALGARSIVAIDGVPERLQLALDVAKVDEVINFNTQDVDEVLKDRKFNAVVDAVGSAKIITEGSHKLVPGGRVCGLGVIPVSNGTIDVHELANHTLYHPHMMPYQRFSVVDEVVDLIRKGILNPKDFYSHVVPFEDIHKAMELVRTKQSLKVILKID